MDNPLTGLLSMIQGGQPQRLPQPQPQQQAPQASPIGDALGPSLRDIFAGMAMGTTPQESMAMAGRVMALRGDQRAKQQQTQARQNQTLQWLQSQGVDANTASYLVSDPAALRTFFAEKQKGSGGVEYGLNPVYGVDEKGNQVVGTFGKDGSFKKIDTGGVKLQSGVEKIDLGDHYQLRDRRTGQVVGVEQKNLKEAEAAKAEGKAQGAAVSEYQSIASKMPGLEKVVNDLDDISNRATYTYAGQALDAGARQLGLAPRDAAIARAEYTAKVDNQILPLLRDTFGAQFTQKEGETLRATLGDPDKSPQEKQAVLRAFIEQKRRDVEALASRAGQSAPPQQHQAAKRLKFNPSTGALE